MFDHTRTLHFHYQQWVWMLFSFILGRFEKTINSGVISWIRSDNQPLYFLCILLLQCTVASQFFYSLLRLSATFWSHPSTSDTRTYALLKVIWPLDPHTRFQNLVVLFLSTLAPRLRNVILNQDRKTPQKQLRDSAAFTPQQHVHMFHIVFTTSQKVW